MERLTTDNPQGNFEAMLNYVYSKDGIAHIRNDGVNDNVPLHEWARRECIARGCDEFPGETFEEIDEAICDCAFDHGECPIFLAYTFACQACHLRDRLKRYEDAEQEGRLVVLPCKVGDTVYAINHGKIDEATFIGDAFGKTIFLTRKEAEAALKGGAE